MSSSSRSSEPDIDPAMMLAFMAGCVVLLVVCLVAVEVPVLLWSLVHLRPVLLSPVDAIGGGLQYLFSGDHMAYPRALRPVAELLPPPHAWVVLNVTGLLAALVLAFAVWLRFDLWSGRSTVGLASWDPRKKVKPRAWGKPRDWLHLQPRWGSRSSAMRVGTNELMRVLVGERRAPEPVGGDSWNLGRLRGAEVRSGREMHELVVAPTRSGKTRRVVATEAIEHDGPLVVLSNKLDVLQITREARERRGPVWVYAPLSELQTLECDGWTPLVGCEQRERALLMAQWIFDADPTASEASDSSGGARFYNREAVELLMPALLQAAAIGQRSMGDVLGWLRGGVDALDVPREILVAHTDPDTLAWASAEALAGVQSLDDRARTYLMMSAAQLISAYRLPAVQLADHAEFDPEELLRNKGTLYLIAPEGQMDALAPIFGGILGEILRACELRAQGVRDPRRLPLLKLLCDEAAHLAPLGQLPTLLSVSASWGVRFCVIYQSLAQIRHRYGVQADAVTANALSKIVLGPVHDRATRDEIVALLGHELVEQTSYTSDRFGGSGSTTRHEQHRPALGAEQLARLGEGEAIVIHGRELPAVVRLPFYDEWMQAPLPDETDPYGQLG
jgi:type IV secretion system protein VirD4